MKMKNATKNGFGVASLVMGILSLLVPYIGFILGILAIIFANKQRKNYPTGTATAGFVLGIIGLCLNAILLFVMILGVITIILLTPIY